VKVILTEDITALGTAGSVVEVSRGYARNYLIPKGKALEATAANLKRLEQEASRRLRSQLKQREAAAALAARLEGLMLTIPQRVGEGERLYGSVTSAMITDALMAQGFNIDRKQLELPEPLKKLGTYEVNVRVAPEMKARISVQVVPEQ